MGFQLYIITECTWQLSDGPVPNSVYLLDTGMVERGGPRMVEGSGCHTRHPDTRHIF